MFRPPPLTSLHVCPQVECGGLFELKIRGFENLASEDSAGRCCRGGRTPRGQCSAPCATRLRVCLMHYQRVIEERPECTFGETVTPVLGGSSFRLDEQPTNVSFNNPIAFPFNFSWPVSEEVDAGTGLLVVLVVLVDPGMEGRSRGGLGQV